jgi:SAM-dependent methyltransferase
LKISWITYSAFKVVETVPQSNEADARYRVFAPVQELHAIGHDIEVIYFAPGLSASQMLCAVQGQVAVLGKLVPPTHQAFPELAATALNVVKGLQARSVKVIADINDNHFESSLRAPYFRELAMTADAIVASTPKMAEIITSYTPRPVTVVRDPYEGRRGEARFEPARLSLSRRLLGASGVDVRPKLLWYGYPTNLDTLIVLRDQLLPLAQRQPLTVRVMSRQGSDAETLCNELHATCGGRIWWTFAAWSLAEIPKALEETDLVVLPSNTVDSTKAVKSPNRLVNGLWAGRFVIAHPLPSYEEFTDYAWVGENIADGVRWALQNPQAVAERIVRGQKYVEERYSPFAAAREWEEAIARLCGDPDSLRLARAVPDGARPLRLNLGCGNKILPGYVNVDVAPARAGTKPDVICDLRDLSNFDDDSVDEILSVHVVEHFWRWEVDDLLREWVRVLKPGARMVIECPNLKAACETFLENPDDRAGPGQEGETTMWVFYGDPAWKDPLMCHRWGYTPASLGELMKRAGLVDVRQEPAQFKMREPRDMRVVGSKPKRNA